jgi:anti-anti-sigma regulatory factor
VALVTAEPSWPVHFLHLYATETERLSTSSAWLRRGLQLGERVVWSEPSDLPGGRSVASVLEEGGVDVVAARAAGRLVQLPPAEFYPPGSQVTIVDQALADGFPAVRIAADGDTASRTLSPAAFVESERMVEVLCRTRPMSYMCQYERSLTVGSRLDQISEIHPQGLRERRGQVYASGDVVELAGEFDMSNEDVLGAALRAASGAASGASGNRSVALEIGLSRVTFLSRGACRVLVLATEPLRMAGGVVRLAGPQPHVEAALRVLELGNVPHMQLVVKEP